MSRHEEVDPPSPLEAVDASDAGVLVLDEGGEVVGANERAAEVLGDGVADLQGRVLSELTTGLGVDLTDVSGETAVETTLQCRVTTPTGESHSLSLQTRRVDGPESLTVAFLRPAGAPGETEPPVDFRAIAETSST